MGPTVNSVLGIAFVVLGFSATLLMYKIWGYPYDKKTHTSSAPKYLVALHRVCGISFVLIYLVLMVQMVPRLWSYQIEFPARTAVHITIGMGIGVVILLKIAIVRFFPHLTNSLVPFLGTGLLIAACLTVGLSVPFALQEIFLARSALPADSLRAENLARVELLLEDAGLDNSLVRKSIASSPGLKAGRAVLTGKCVSCHDLRTVLSKPRTATSWRSTVTRMAKKASVFDPITEDQQWQVTAYLIALSPDLQASAEAKAVSAKAAEKTASIADEIVNVAAASESAVKPVNYLPHVGQQIFETKCSQCHEFSKVDEYPIATYEEAAKLVARMVKKDDWPGATEQELAFVTYYLSQTYGESK